MTARSVCMALCVRGAIRNLQSSRSKKTGYQHNDGRPMNKQEAIDALLDEIAKGHETIPMSKRCGNPCQSKGCTGFDYSATGGCPGFDYDGDGGER